MKQSLVVRYLSFLALIFTMLSGGFAYADKAKLTLDGSKEVPPVTTKASGKAMIEIDTDRSVSGEVTVSDIKATAAHIHVGSPKQNGPVGVGMEKTSENSFEIPAGAKLNDQQYEAYQTGNLYINVHSTVYPDGEIRAQIPPPKLAK